MKSLTFIYLKPERRGAPFGRSLLVQAINYREYPRILFDCPQVVQQCLAIRHLNKSINYCFYFVAKQGHWLHWRFLNPPFISGSQSGSRANRSLMEEVAESLKNGAEGGIVMKNGEVSRFHLGGFTDN